MTADLLTIFRVSYAQLFLFSLLVSLILGVSFSYKLVKCCMCGRVCLDVNQGGTNRNRFTQRLVIFHAQTY